MSVRKTIWRKRIVAVIMATSMLVTMTSAALAEDVTGQSDSPSFDIMEENGGVAVEGDASGDSIADNKNENAFIDDAEEEEQDVKIEGGISVEDSIIDTDTATEMEANETTGNDSAESDTEEKTGAEDWMEDSSEIELCLNLLSVTDSDDASSMLSLDKALSIAGSGNDAVLSSSDDILTVTGSKGLILLSNVTPDDYHGRNINLVTKEGWDLTQEQTYTYTDDSGKTQAPIYSFLGLGSEANPYAGTMTIAEGSETHSITAKRALFNFLSTDATLPANINFMMAGSNSGQIVLADTVVNSRSTEKPTLDCKVTLTQGTSDDAASSDIIGGIIGTLEEGTSVSVKLINNLTDTLTVSGSDHRGLFCNTMNENSSLTASLTNSGMAIITVAAASGDAGGYVGKMSGDNTLTVSGNAVNIVTSTNGNAGGLVGSAVDAMISVTGGETTPFSLIGVTVTAANNRSVGGLVGDYTKTNTTDITLELAQFTLSTTLAGGTNVGGVFGVLNNSGYYTISGGSVTSNLTAGTNYGGVIGIYEAQDNGDTPARNAALSIFNGIQITSNGGSNATTYGGVIGKVRDSSYVAIENASVSTAVMPAGSSSYFGGLVGQLMDGLLNVGSVQLATTDGNDIAADDVGGRGGLVGYIEKGVLRLHGTTDLSSQKITTAYHHTGQIVGSNESGLVYATGTGNKLDESGNGWLLKRYESSRSGSDIGNWGEVVRLDGSKLKETTEADLDALFVFDQTNHVVTVQGATVTSGTDSATGATTNTVTLAGTRDFAAYALAFNLKSSTNYADDNGTLIFNTRVDSSVSQTATLSYNVILTGTGILGIGRDDNTQTFTGIFDGGSKTITLDIGSTYGDGINVNSGNGSGQIYMRRSNGRECHTSLALFPYTDSAAVKNLIVNGKVNCLIAQKGNNSEAKWPVFGAGVVGNAYGDTTFLDVTVSADISIAIEGDGESKSLYVAQAGILGQYAGDGSLGFTNCRWKESTLKNNRTTDNNRIGGFAGRVLGDSKVTVSNCTLSGTIQSSTTSHAAVGGMFAESLDQRVVNNNFLYKGGNSISISNLTVTGEIINTSASNTSGGLLGYKWNKTDVTFGGTMTDSEGIVTATTGVEIKNSTLNANSAKFGGLVYQATGYWNATAEGSIQFTGTNTITGGTGQDAPSGLLVGTGLITSNTENNALYLEIGTWGSAVDAAYTIGSGAVQLTLSGSANYFDELVGITIENNEGHDNAVVSLATPEHGLIDKDACNTYTGQLGTSYKNGKVRYYYNLDNYRILSSETGLSTLSAEELDSAGDVVSWSVSQYAASNIRDYFCKKINNTYNAKISATGSDSINLSGYSYYPVSPLSTVEVKDSTLTFAYDIIESAEENNKKPDDSDQQHYLMHHGLLYNAGSNVTVTDTTFKGTVGLQIMNNSTNSGALIFGKISGDTTKSPAIVPTVKLSEVKLAGLRVSGAESASYAPLLINTINEAVTLTVDDLTTADGYVENNDTVSAATSLIGKVGSGSATRLTMTFSEIALDSRKTASSDNATFVMNNNATRVEYLTTHTIFTHATLLESFQYSADSSGVYNFNSTDAQVTYGVEISNTESGRNIDKPNKQYQYYDGGYVWDGLGDTTTTEETIKTYFSSGNYLRYINFTEGTSGGYHELDINQKATNLTEGCGTYGDPYIITDGQQLIDLAKYIDGKDASGFQVKFNKTVIADKKQEEGSYHTESNDEGNDVTFTFTFSDTSWSTETTGAPSISNDDAQSYLLNAYYKINTSIEISLTAGDYQGLGSKDNPFSGVITGNTVRLTGTLSGQKDFSGLIRYSRGSVVKDMTVDYTDATITMSNGNVPDSTNTPFFGGVVGYCMGGDTIIENVSVTYGENSVSLAGGMTRLIAAGGYVGLVGGAKDTSNNMYEKTGGGVVFREISASGNFPCKDSEGNDVGAALEAPEVATNGTSVTSMEGKSTYFYCNPYVGRVLDGYACYDGGTAGQSTLNNTDKNYTIPDLANGTSDLTVNGSNVTVTSEQGLWLLSAIVNSGAGAMDSKGTYQDYGNNNYVEAYQYGKVRSASYEGIGTDVSDKTAALTDEAWWGGQTYTDQERVSYLVKKFTASVADGMYYAAQLTGRSNTNDNSSTNNPVALTFDAESIDMSSYGNGFRGIGGSYGDNQNIWSQNSSLSALNKVYRRTLLVSSIVGADEVTQITLAMNQHNFIEEYNFYKNNNSKEKCWLNQGAGLFVDFSYKSDCTVQKLRISGNIQVSMYSSAGSLEKIDKSNYDVGVGGFAARTANASGLVTFTNFHLSDLTLYGGTGVGGVFGVTESTGGAKNITIENWTAQNVSASNWIQKEGSVGGLVGWHHSRGILTIGSDEESKQSDVEDLSITANVVNQSDGSSGNNAGGLVSASDFSTITIKKVNANNIRVTAEKVRDVGGLVGGYSNNNGNLTITNCNLDGVNVSSTNCVYVGGVVGRSAKNTKIENVTLTGESSVSGVDNAGKEFHVGGLVGRADASIDLSNCHITGSEGKPVIISKSEDNNKPYTGGFIGGSNNTNTIKDCTETYVNILSTGNDAGGLVGQMAGGTTTTNVSNVVFSNVIVATGNNSKRVGLLTGYNENNKTFNGYNILADSCTVGYNINATIDNLGTITSTGTYNGLWFGGSKGTSTLVAVAVKGTNQPQKDVGKIDSGTVSITYADYPADTTDWDGNGSEYPRADVNPQSILSVKESTNASDVACTGNGVGYMMIEGKETSVAQAILTEAKAGENTRKYWNLLTGNDTDIAKFLPNAQGQFTNDVYLTTYQGEEKGTGTTSNTTVPSVTDFPILVVSGLAKADTEIWNYIAALTNVAQGTDAKNQAASVTASTYEWKKNADATVGEDGTFAGSFVKKSSASLSVNTTDKKTISITSNTYDNQQSQFTLLDVKYTDPTNSSNAFHLYVPVLVKKVLYTSFSVKFLAGTNYLKEAYIPFSKNTYATAGFDEPVTAYIEYNYDRKKSDWEQMLINGDDLLWNYNKVLDLASGNTADVNNPILLPDKTLLTLVDKQTGQCYIHTFTSSDAVHGFDLSKMTLDGTADATKQFKPVPICDLLGLTIDETPDPTKPQYVELGKLTEEGTMPDGATVKVGDIYYRKATDTDTGEKYTISVGSSLSNYTSGTNYLSQGEGYYLTIQVPSNSGISVVNNPVDVNSKTMKGTGSNSAAPLAYISEVTPSTYVIYDGVQQSELSISTARNGDTNLDTKMEDGNSIKVILTSTLRLTDTGKINFYNYSPSVLNHQFNIGMKKHLKTDTGESIEDVLIGATRTSYTYTITKKDEKDPLYQITKTEAGSETLDTLSIGCNSKAADDMVTYLKGSGPQDPTERMLVITAEITLSYPTLGTYFPGRSSGDTTSGISVSADSRVANAVSQLSITAHKESADDGNRYYTENPSNAKLTYNTYDGDGAGDSTRKLGINPSDTTNDMDGSIYTNGVYDYSSVDADTLEKAKEIKYTLELFQKDNNGNYNESSPLTINQYLPTVDVITSIGLGENQFIDKTVGNANYLTLKKDLIKDGSGYDSINIKIKPLTGTEFETKNFTYDNYKVCLTAVLLEEDGTELVDTKSSDYIIYTNARIYQQMME